MNLPNFTATAVTATADTYRSDEDRAKEAGMLIARALARLAPGSTVIIEQQDPAHDDGRVMWTVHCMGGEPQEAPAAPPIPDR